jgi:uncharacterized protein (UPF0212 family)
MLITAHGRVVIACDDCPVRMDLGPQSAVEHRNRMPSMWVNIGQGRHACPNCAAQHAARFQRAQTGNVLIS